MALTAIIAAALVALAAYGLGAFDKEEPVDLYYDWEVYYPEQSNVYVREYGPGASCGLPVGHAHVVIKVYLLNNTDETILRKAPDKDSWPLLFGTEEAWMYGAWRDVKNWEPSATFYIPPGESRELYLAYVAYTDTDGNIVNVRPPWYTDARYQWVDHFGHGPDYAPPVLNPGDGPIWTRDY